ncbi:MAG: arginine--tRNA ligase [Parcubacteria group bacterium]|jgi:arginyl-tRNA synthetase
MKSQIQKLIREAIQSAFGIDFDADKIKIDYPPEGMGDFATNVALILAKEAGKSPMEAAEALKREIFGHRMSKKDTGCLPIEFEKIEAAKPGFLNFWLVESLLPYIVVKINTEKEKFGNSEIGAGKKIHLDFVSANPTGPIHVGNARGGPLGDTLANVFEKCGYEPFREYYVNDTGNQADILGHSILGDAEAQYSGEYIEELRKRVEKGEPRKVGEKGAEIVLEEIIKPSMEKFGIKFDNYFSERELQKSGKVDKILEVLNKKGYLHEKEGATWFKSTEFGDDKDRVVVKSNGEKTYFGTDIAYHNEKLKRGFDKLIDIWGADHHGEVKRTHGALKALGHENKLDVILTQFVRILKNGEEMKMSKRAGTYVSVDDLIDEVGKDATRFFFLMHSADTHMNFDMDLAKERSEKNPVYYVQYAHARICSIFEKAEDANLTFNVRSVLTLNVRNHAKERALILELLKFPDLVSEISQNYAVHYLPQYTIGLADKFHSFYDECRVIDENNLELTAQRLELVKAVRIVLKEVLRLMGISAPDRM